MAPRVLLIDWLRILFIIPISRFLRGQIVTSGNEMGSLMTSTVVCIGLSRYLSTMRTNWITSATDAPMKATAQNNVMMICFALTSLLRPWIVVLSANSLMSGWIFLFSDAHSFVSSVFLKLSNKNTPILPNSLNFCLLYFISM